MHVCDETRGSYLRKCGSGPLSADGAAEEEEEEEEEDEEEKLDGRCMEGKGGREGEAAGVDLASAMFSDVMSGVCVCVCVCQCTYCHTACVCERVCVCVI
jgi:hypothetical protein